MYLVIDIGSNTIRAVVFHLEGEKLTPVLNKKYSAGLAGYVQPDGTLSREGIDLCIDILSEIRILIDTFNFNGEFSGAQGKILHFMLAQSEDVFQRDIEEAFSLRPPTASEILKKMEQNGLISRQPVSYDTRLKKIVLLPKALQYKNRVTHDLACFEEELAHGISPEDMKVFYRVVEQMLNNLS